MKHRYGAIGLFLALVCLALPLSSYGQELLFPAPVFSTGARPQSIASGDFDNNGKPDLATANSDANTVSILFNNGNGIFAAKVDYATGAYPYSVAVGDFNGDSKPDVAVANYFASTVSVLLNNGNGTFAPKVDYAADTGSRYVAVGDLNGDNTPD